MDTISVIIPAYNVEPYIGQCLQSVIDQSYKALDIIIIDDGSSDQTGDICEEFASNDARIRVVHQSNSGRCIARNRAMDIARGEWFYFLDSDDWIEPEMLEKLLNLAERHNSDVGSCLSSDEYLNGNSRVPHSDLSVFDLTYTDILFNLPMKNVARFELWNKLWNRSIVNDIRFIPGQISEEIHFSRIAYPRVNKMTHINEVLHHYRVNRPGSTLSSFKSAKLSSFREYEEWIKEEDNQYNKDLLRRIACTTSMYFYLEAYRTKQKRKIRNEISSFFKKMYSDIEDRTLITAKSRVFLISPELFCMLSTLKSLL